MTKRSSTKPPPKSWTFFTDRDLGNIVPDALIEAGYWAERHDTHFPNKTPDEVWLPVVGNHGWLALTRDKGIRRIHLERDTAMRAGLALFVLVGKMPHPELAKNLVATAPRIIHFREKYDPPFIAMVYRPDAKFPVGSRPGRVEMALREAEWIALLKAGK